MKKYLIIILFISAFTSKAQVAINSIGQAPNSSAILDLSSSSKGLLIPRVALQSAVDNTTVPNAAASLLVYNTNTLMFRGVGFYYNKGSAASPQWEAMQNLVLPHSQGTSTSGNAFSIENYSATPASSAIRGYHGSSGIGVMAKSVSGNALEVEGKMKLSGTGQAPGVGKVLTSDENGQATWEGAVAFSAVGIKGGGSQVIANGTETKVAFGTEVYDPRNNFNDVNTSPHNVFTAPVDGIYNFNVRVRWFFDDVAYLFLHLVRKRNNVITVLASDDFDLQVAHPSQKINMDTKLIAGDEVYVIVQQNSGTSRSLYTDQHECYFSGRLMVKQ